MLSSIFIALLQAVAGDPAAPADAQAAQTETPAAAPAEPRYERRRVCRQYPPATGSRFGNEECRYQRVRVDEPAPEAEDGANQGGGEATAAPAPSDQTAPQ